MRLLATVTTVLLLSLGGCDGESSVLMSVWNDGGPGGGLGGQGGGAGGQGGQVLSGAGGAAGAGGALAGGSVVVPGGVRDLTTAMCTQATGGTCVAPPGFISCAQTYCSAKLVACYYSDGVSVALGGVCQAYANCMLASPCDSRGTKFQNDCALNFATTDCGLCLASLLSCFSTYGCGDPYACSFPSATGGASGSH